MVGWALAYAAAGTALLYAGSLVAGPRSWRRLLPAGFVILFFAALSQVPLPDADRLVCPVPAARPSLVPFVEFVDRMVLMWGRTESLWQWLGSSGGLAHAMNLLLFVLIGALLGGQGFRPGAVVGLGFALSLAVELTQLSGLWGLYPCAYRQFDVDDLVLNTLGAALGVRAARWGGARG